MHFEGLLATRAQYYFGRNVYSLLPARLLLYARTNILGGDRVDDRNHRNSGSFYGGLSSDHASRRGFGERRSEDRDTVGQRQRPKGDRGVDESPEEDHFQTLQLVRSWCGVPSAGYRKDRLLP